MPEIAGLTGTPTKPPGYHVTTRSGGEEYHTMLRLAEESDLDADLTVYEVTERWKIGDDGLRTDLQLKTTRAVEEFLADREVAVK